MKKILKVTLLTFALLLSSLPLSACGGAKDAGITLTVFNYGKYLDEKLIKKFKKETGITIKYEEYATPEEMYTKYKAGSIKYDVICTSEYMIEKLIGEGEVLEQDYASLSNYGNLDTSILTLAEAYDKDHKYTVPYFYGTLGLLYDPAKVSADVVSSWKCLWDPAYANEIIMENSVRDSFAPALAYLGYSLNETDETHLREALDLLIKQKKDGIPYAYYVDETANAMAAGEAKIALCYSGEAALAMETNEDLAYAVPKEGSNLWIDSWFIPKTCQNSEAAMKFIDFLCRNDVAKTNFEYVCYASPITSVIEGLDDETKNNEAIIPSPETVKKCEIFTALSDETATLYNNLWKELGATKKD